MNTNTWKNWIPGVLSDSQVKELIKDGLLMHLEPDSGDIDASAINLRLAAGTAWRMKKGAVKPFGGNYEHFLNTSGYAEEIEFNNAQSLQTRTTYVFKLKLVFSRQFMKAGCFNGHATGRSSVGRVDVLTRLIVDGMDQYEGFSGDRIAEHGSGSLFLEVTPITFAVCVKPDTALSQLRLFFGLPESCLIEGRDIVRTTLRSEETNEFPDGVLSLSLQPEQHDLISAFGAKIEGRDGGKDLHPRAPVSLWKLNENEKPSPSDYWHRIKAQPSEQYRDWFIEIQHTYFYILKSHEKLCLPSGVAVYCKPSDETIGEMRIHYAGFVHPWFGMNREDGEEGTPLIFEVRGTIFQQYLDIKKSWLASSTTGCPAIQKDPKRPTRAPTKTKASSFQAISKTGQRLRKNEGSSNCPDYTARRERVVRPPDQPEKCRVRTGEYLSRN